MSIPVQRSCGRSFRVKEEWAGRRARCSACGSAVKIPRPESEPDAEDEAHSLLLADSATDNPPSPEEPQEKDITAEEEGRQSRRPSPPRKSERSARKAERARRPAVERASLRRSGPPIVVNSRIIMGLFMMVGAAVWFFVGLANNIIFFYPPILFVFGIAAVIQGFSGGD